MINDGYFPPAPTLVERCENQNQLANVDKNAEGESSSRKKCTIQGSSLGGSSAKDAEDTSAVLAEGSKAQAVGLGSARISAVLAA